MDPGPAWCSLSGRGSVRDAVEQVAARGCVPSGDSELLGHGYLVESLGSSGVSVPVSSSLLTSKVLAS